MVGFLLKKANLSTPHRPSTCAAIFLFVDAASLWRAEIVKASLPEVNQFTGNCFRMVRMVLKITFLGLRYPGQRPECPSLSYYGSWRKLLLLGIQAGDKLAKPPFFVAYSRLCRHCRNLAAGGCRLSPFHLRLCRYFLGHVACRNLPWQGLLFPYFRLFGTNSR